MELKRQIGVFDKNEFQVVIPTNIQSLDQLSIIYY